ncbi:hypothetical protein [Alcaligenes faecalis]|uniref:hypothetical protein n=1 Tax=Alcaligenes faecalis TaxID=511 RepID=UPI0029328778|nr:hypothetical protein [Alcaligenes faecalis]MDV2115327.1 hypothetical protein [Alcaligenes faecalis]
MNAQQQTTSVGVGLSDHKELEIERELFLQRNGLSQLESSVGRLLERLEQVMRPSDPPGANACGEPEKFPQTSLGDALRTNSNRIGGLNEAVSDALCRLELS